MKSIQFDADGLAVRGTYPISTVALGMWGADGTPHPTVTSAVCDVCGDWASNMWTAGKSTRSGSLTDVRVSRVMTVIVYACPVHSEQIAASLTDEFGGASNAYDPDDLAAKVDGSQRSR